MIKNILIVLVVFMIISCSFEEGKAIDAIGQTNTSETIKVDISNQKVEELSIRPEQKIRDWSLEITPLLYFPFINGDLNFRRRYRDINIGPGDFLPNLRFATFGRIEFWKKNIGVMAYGNYAIIHQNYDRKKGFGLVERIKVDSQQGKLNLAASYRFKINMSKKSDKQIYLEPYLGVSQNYIKGQLKFENRRRNRKIAESNYWAELFMGGRIQVPITQKINYWLRGDIGGFGIGAANHFTTNMQTGLEFKPRRWLGFKVWYYLNTINRSAKRNIGLNLVNQGPGVGLTFYP